MEVDKTALNELLSLAELWECENRLRQKEYRQSTRKPRSVTEGLGRCFSDLPSDLILSPAPNVYSQPEKTTEIPQKIRNGRAQSQLDWIKPQVDNPAPVAYTVPATKRHLQTIIGSNRQRPVEEDARGFYLGRENVKQKAAIHINASPRFRAKGPLHIEFSALKRRQPWL